MSRTRRISSRRAGGEARWGLKCRAGTRRAPQPCVTSAAAPPQPLWLAGSADEVRRSHRTEPGVRPVIRANARLNAASD